MMRSTYDIDPKLLSEAQAMLDEKSPSKAINFALRELVRRQKLQDLRRMLGTMDIEDNWRELEEQELEDMRRNQR
jgi:Arc/MetJ family transcription regulator